MNLLKKIKRRKKGDLFHQPPEKKVKEPTTEPNYPPRPPYEPTPDTIQRNEFLTALSKTLKTFKKNNGINTKRTI